MVRRKSSFLMRRVASKGVSLDAPVCGAGGDVTSLRCRSLRGRERVVCR